MANDLQLTSVLKGLDTISTTHHGNHTLDAISGAGQTNKPKLALVFINPTHRNISTQKKWEGIKAPWIGCNNIWKLFVDAGLIEESIYAKMLVFGKEWPEAFADEVYRHVQKRELYITNIVKWAGLDAKLPEKSKMEIYLPLLMQELGELNADKIVLFGQLTFDAVIRGMGLHYSFKQLNEAALKNSDIPYVPTRYGRIVACYFPVGQGIKNVKKAEEILRLAYND